MAKLAPSLLSADFYNLENQIKILEKNKIEYLHLDCMDGRSEEHRLNSSH